MVRATKSTVVALAEEPYDLEFRAEEDDAWYSVRVVFDSEAETLTVKYDCSPPVEDFIYSSKDFKTAEKVEEMVRRFRPVSEQLQDSECGKLPIGTVVCASYACSKVDELKFFDAKIDTVIHHRHSFAKGIEVCKCRFDLLWQHGYPRGTLTSANIASMCTIVHNFDVDAKISAFAMLVKEKISSSILIKISKSSPNILQEMEIDNVCKNEGVFSNYTHRKIIDDDMGGKLYSIDGWGTCNGQYFILINNMETNLTTSSINQFIYGKTNIQPQAIVFPSLLHDRVARGAILIDTQPKFQKIYEFLCNPGHLIVSSGLRPWVVNPKQLVGSPFWNSIPLSHDMLPDKKSKIDLHVVLSGTKEYNKAKKLKDLFLQLLNHETQVCKKLVLEEKKILRSFPSN